MEYEDFLKEFSGILDKMSDMISVDRKAEYKPKHEEVKSHVEKSKVPESACHVSSPTVAKKTEPEHKYITIQVDNGNMNTANVVCNNVYSGDEGLGKTSIAMVYALARLIAKDTGGDENDVAEICEVIEDAMTEYSIGKLMSIFKAVMK